LKVLDIKRYVTGIKGSVKRLVTCKYLLSVGVSKMQKVGGLPDTNNSR